MRRVGDLTLPEVEDLFDYWQDHPPVHEMIANFLGYRPRYRDPDELADPVAETERWMRIEEECATQDLSGLVGAMGPVMRVGK